ncbi:MAG: MBL fold metallo-hydrolase [Phycisphaerales bacterium]
MVNSTWFAWSKISPKCWVAQGEGGNTLVIAGHGEGILVDTKMPGFGSILRREAEFVCGVPIRTVINTHHHRDHVGGNNAFTKNCVVMMQEKGVPRVASLGAKLLEAAKSAALQVAKSEKPGKTEVAREVEAFVAAAPALEAFVPNRIVRGSESLTIGEMPIEFIHVGSGHSDSDLIVWLPREDVLHSGDLIFNRAWPYVDRSGGMHSAGWIAGCERLLEICDEKTVVVPGHGDVDIREAARRQRDLFVDLRKRAERAVKSGGERAEFVALVLDEYRDLARAETLKAMALGGLWDEAAGVPAA